MIGTRRALAVAALAAALAAAAAADDAADREALVREIVALRGPEIGAGDPGWPAWSPTSATCSSTWSRAWTALTEFECGQEAARIWVENRAAGVAFHHAIRRLLETGEAGAAGSAAWQTLEVTARSLGVPTSVVKCIWKTYVHLTLAPGVEKQEAMTRIDALADGLDLAEFLTSAHKILTDTRGWRALGETTGQAAADLANQAASGPTQGLGWLDNFQKAAETFHVHFEAAMAIDVARAEGNADRCFFEGAAADLAALEPRALDYLVRMRRYVAETEQAAFCAVAESWIAWPAGRRVLGDWPEVRNRVEAANLFEGRARSTLLDLRARRHGAEERLRSEGRRRDEIATELEAIARALASGGECSDTRPLVRDLERLAAESCFDAAWARSGLGGSVHELRSRLIGLANARDAFFTMVEQAAGDARAAGASCRFDDGRRLVEERFRRFDQQWAPHAAGAFAACWRPPWRSDPFPLDALRSDFTAAEREIAAASAAAAAAAARVRERSAACAWSEAMAALGELDAAVRAIRCPPGHAEVDRWTAALATERAAVEARWAEVRPRQEAYEAAWRDLLASLEQELFRAEQPQEPGRCAAADRVLEMVGVGAGFTPPLECPPPPELVDHRRRLAEAGRRAEAARRLGREELARLVPAIEAALGRCEVAAAASGLADLAALPILCGADRDGTAARLGRELEALERRVEAFRGKIEPFAREWAEAYGRCSITGLLGVANRIAAWAGDRCAAEALSAPERARVRALVARDAAAVEALAGRRESLRTRVAAKISIAEGYLASAREALRRGDDPAHGRSEIQRVVADAFAEVAATPDVPHACLEDLLARLAGLGAELESILAALPPMTSPDDCTAWPGTAAEPDPATGRLRCVCPSGTAWSVVRSACLSLGGAAAPPGSGGGAVDCTGQPGTLPRRDPATGFWSCRCPVGDWSAGEGRCVTPWEGLPEPTLSTSGDSDFCEVLRTMIRQAVAMGDRGQAERYAETARVAACVGIEGMVPSAGGAGGGPREEGSGRVSSRNVEICVIDANSVLDDHYTLVVNGLAIGTVQNPEGGRSCFRSLLAGGENVIELRLIREMGKNTALVISLNGGEYEGSFGGSHDHVWRISAP